MGRYDVLYDGRCGLCRWAKAWAQGLEMLEELVFIEAGSPEANRRFPTLSRPGVPEELILVSEYGEVYRDESAWIMCLYALADYREWSLRLASPTLRPLARQAFALVSGQRGRISWWLGLSDEDAVAALARVEVPGCGRVHPSELIPVASGLHKISA